MGYNVSGKMWQEQTYDGQTSGYLTKWADTKFAFLTVHGAGHEVSQSVSPQFLPVSQSVRLTITLTEDKETHYLLSTLHT